VTKHLGLWYGNLALLGTHVSNKATYKHVNLIQGTKLAFIQIVKKADGGYS
jgi:hypothetical protein